MAITGTVLYLLFILAFIIHDGGEIAMEHKWLLAHGDALREKHPKLRRMLNHLRKMNTTGFAIAVLEELILLVAITVYVFWGGPYAVGKDALSFGKVGSLTIRHGSCINSNS